MESTNPKIKNLYQQWAYPEPIDDLSIFLQSHRSLTSIDSPIDFWNTFPGAPFKVDLSVLIAGCGSYQAAVHAFLHPEAAVVGVDLSEKSLAYTERLKKQHGLKNLELVKLSLTDLPTDFGVFDYVVSTGVLHHLPDPCVGLKTIARHVADQGAISLMLYGKSLRYPIYFLQNIFKILNVGFSIDDVSNVRRFITEVVPSSHPIRRYMNSATDLTSDAGLVDTFLNPQDMAFEVDEIYNLVDTAGLRFDGWLDNGKYFPGHYNIPVGKIRELFPQWDYIGFKKQCSICDSLGMLLGTHRFIARRQNASSFLTVRSEVEFQNWIPIYKPLKFFEFSEESGNTSLVRMAREPYVSTPLRFEGEAAQLANMIREQVAMRELRRYAVDLYGDKRIDASFAADQLVADLWLRGHIVFGHAGTLHLV